MKQNVVAEKSFLFAVQVVAFCRALQEETREYVLSKQLLRSGTSIGANVEEGIGAISKREFVAKMQIAYKEARETKYWLRLLKAAGLLHNEADELIDNVEELQRILRAILISAKGASDRSI